MATKKKKKQEEKLPPFLYNDEVKKLKDKGPERLYLIWGEEDYLADLFVGELRKCCLPDGEDDFSYHKFTERDFDLTALEDAVSSIPFMTERSFVEVRRVDINHLDEENTKRLLKLLESIPEYCTVVFLQSPEFQPDRRKKLYKELPKLGTEYHVGAQSDDALINWIIRRFAAQGKRIELNAVMRLMNVSGNLMNKLIPEIDKVASFAAGSMVTVADVDAVAHHIPESKVFDMVKHISFGNTGAALTVLDELIASKESDEIATVAAIGYQMRHLYAARLVIDKGLDRSFLKTRCGVSSEYQINDLMNNARRFSLQRLKNAVELCAETDHKLKSSGTAPQELLKECVLMLASGGTNV